MTTARELVDVLLEDCLEEAIPKAGAALTVFGPDAPSEGYFFNGPDAFGEFIQSKRGSEALLRTSADRKRYVDWFKKNGYILIFQTPQGFDVYTERKLYIPPDGIKAMEQTMKLTQNTPMIVNGAAPVPAGKLIYGQPDPLNPKPQQQGQQQQASPSQVAQQKGLMLKGSFGGAYGPQGHLEPGNKINVDALDRGLRKGYAYVIKYPKGGLNVFVPAGGYKFSRTEIAEMEAEMGVKPSSLAQLFVGSASPANIQKTVAAVAIYGRTPQKPTPAGMATPPPTP